MPEARSSAPLRLFVGIVPGEEVLVHLDRVVQTIRELWHGSRLLWVPRDNLHLTLRFIGATEPTRVDALDQALARALVRTGPLKMQVGPLSTGGPPVVGLDVSGDDLNSRQRAVEEALVMEGLASELRPYRPHLTLARFADRREARRFFRWAAQLGVDVVRAQVPWVATEVHLLESRAIRGRTVYRSLRRYDLGKGE
jgi:2'-5' RNA ligase